MAWTRDHALNSFRVIGVISRTAPDAQRHMCTLLSGRDNSAQHRAMQDWAVLRTARQCQAV
eukprot:15459438-Alexandrium_andersonii.AAC.1